MSKTSIVVTVMYKLERNYKGRQSGAIWGSK